MPSQDTARWDISYSAAHEQALHCLLHVAIFADVLRTELELQRCEPGPETMAALAATLSATSAVMADALVAVRMHSMRFGASVEPALRQVLTDLGVPAARQAWGPH